MTMITATIASMYIRFLTGLVFMQASTGLEGKINEIIDTVTTITRPLAILALTIGFLAMVFEPMLPDFARENKGVIRRVLIALIGIGLVPELVNLFVS